MNLSEEVREDYLISSQMKKVWSIQLELLKELLTVCSKHNLKIWACGGTLLGVIRHKGYIPWDDDIDMVMPRKDYDQLIKIAPKAFKDPFYLQSAYTEKKYPRGHAQLRMKGTSAILPPDLYQSFDQSIFIDIFVYDGIPNDEKELNKLRDESSRLKTLMHRFTYPIFISKNYHIVYQSIKAKLYFLFHSFQKTFNDYENCFRKYDTEESILWGQISFAFDWALKFNILKKEYFKETIYLPFEDIFMPVPIEYDKVLRRQYGDYMQPVKAPSMHGEVIFDTERSYKEVIKELRKERKQKR